MKLELKPDDDDDDDDDAAAAAVECVVRDLSRFAFLFGFWWFLFCFRFFAILN